MKRPRGQEAAALRRGDEAIPRRRDYDDKPLLTRTFTHTRPYSHDADCARVLQSDVPLTTEGAGNAGRLAAPAALRAKSESTQA